MHKAWLAAVAAGALVATSSVAFAHGHHEGSGPDRVAAAQVHLAASAATSATADKGDKADKGDTDKGDKSDLDPTGTALTTATGTVTAVGSGTFSLQETTPNGSETVVVTYGASTVIRPASATIAVGDRVSVRGTMSNGKLAASEIAVQVAGTQAPAQSVHGTLAAPVTLSVATASGTQSVSLAAGTKVEVDLGGLHVEGKAAPGGDEEGDD